MTDTHADREPVRIERDKANGTVAITIYQVPTDDPLVTRAAISTQKADSIARSMFVVPVRLAYKGKCGHTGYGYEIRVYRAIGWL